MKKLEEILTEKDVRPNFDADTEHWIFELAYQVADDFCVIDALMGVLTDGHSTKDPLNLMVFEDTVNAICNTQSGYRTQIETYGIEEAKVNFVEVFLNRAKQDFRKMQFDWVNTEKAKRTVLDSYTQHVEGHRLEWTERGFDDYYRSIRGADQFVATLQYRCYLEFEKRLFATPEASTLQEGKAGTPKNPTKKQKKALDELVTQLSESNVAIEGAIQKAAKKVSYSKDNVWKLYGKVKRGELAHEKLTVIITSKSSSD